MVVMVVYHAMNIFSTAGPDEYAYVRFVSGSFILMSGYIVARFDGPRFKADWRGTSRRLVARGLKLLILFTLLNLLINLTGIGNPDKVQLGIQRYMSTLFEVYVSGEPGYASFQILLPIAYLLVAAPALLMLGRLSKWLFVASFAMAVCSFVVRDRIGQSGLCDVRGDRAFRRHADKCSGKAIRDEGCMEHSWGSSGERDADEIPECGPGDVCIGNNSHSQAALRSEQGCRPGEPSRSGINFTWAILVGLLHCSDYLHAGVVQGALETTMGVGIRDDFRRIRNSRFSAGAQRWPGNAVSTATDLWPRRTN